LTFKSDTNSLIYNVPYFSLGAWSFVWGAKPTKALRSDGTNDFQDSNVLTANA